MGWEHIDTPKKLTSSPSNKFIGKQVSGEDGEKGKRRTGKKEMGKKVEKKDMEIKTEKETDTRTEK